ncbi:MAG: ADP-ribosylglycohydrolase family protein [Clostridia bacterium]
MLGAIIGDIAGSRFEWDNCRSKDFTLFDAECEFTDDSAMSIAIAWAILQCRGDWKRLGSRAVRSMQEIGLRYPFAGYGGMFGEWIMSDKPQPYNSLGNGAAMRVSPCGFAASSMQEAKDLSRIVTAVTHNHPEGIKGAEATAIAVWLARNGKSIDEIKRYICENYYTIDFTLDEIRETYMFNETCMNTVPQALEAFFESTGFEDAIRNAVSIGGDSDTIAAITGGVAEAFYGIPQGFGMSALAYLDEDLIRIVTAFEKRYPRKRK